MVERAKERMGERERGGLEAGSSSAVPSVSLSSCYRLKKKIILRINRKNHLSFVNDPSLSRGETLSEYTLYTCLIL